MVDLDDLRAWGTGCGSRGYRLTHDAAAEIERLRAEVERLSGLLDSQVEAQR